MGRTSFREKFFAQKFNYKEFDWDGEKLFIKSPSFKERNDIVTKATKMPDTKEGMPTVDMDAMQLHALINLVVDDEHKPCFTYQDAQVIQATPATPLFTELVNAVMSALNVRADDVKDVEKN